MPNRLIWIGALGIGAYLLWRNFRGRMGASIPFLSGGQNSNPMIARNRSFATVRPVIGNDTELNRRTYYGPF